MSAKPYPLCGPLYAERDAMALGQHYANHIHAMTKEQLNSKSAIAAELAWRDQRIAELEARVAELQDYVEGRAQFKRVVMHDLAEPSASDDDLLLDTLERVSKESMTGISVVYRSPFEGAPGGFVAMRRRYQTRPFPTLREAVRALIAGGEK